MGREASGPGCEPRLAAVDTCTSLTLVSGLCSLDAGGQRLSLHAGQTLLVPAGMPCEAEGSDATIIGASPEP